MKEFFFENTVNAIIHIKRGWILGGPLDWRNGRAHPVCIEVKRGHGKSSPAGQGRRPSI